METGIAVRDLRLDEFGRSHRNTWSDKVIQVAGGGFGGS